MLAALPVRPIAVGVLLLAFVIWLTWLLRLASGGRRGNLPANLKPYHTDEELERNTVVKVGIIGLFSAVGVAVVVAIYWLFLPTVQANWDSQFTKESIVRGAKLFATTADGGLNCAGCHGGGQGGKVDYVIGTGPNKGIKVSWECPPIDDVYYRFTREEVKRVLIFGRPGTPMPAWGIAGGGGQTDQEIEDLLTYLKFIEVAPDQAGKRAGTDAQGNALVDGQSLFLKNCARCHTPTFSYTRPEDRLDLPQGIGAYGPSLLNEETQFPAIEDHISFIQQGSLADKSYGVSGIGDGRMPGFAKDPDNPLLSEEQIRAIAEYERSLDDTYDVAAGDPYESTATISPAEAQPAAPATEEEEEEG